MPKLNFGSGVSTIAVILTLAGCSKPPAPEIKDCESNLLSKLKAPSTYKRAAVSSIRISDAKSEYQSVSIDYDAQNSYGAPIRDKEICVYPIDGDTVRTDLSIDPSADLESALAGEGYYAPNAKMPSIEERREQLSREVDNIVAAYQAERNSN